jgi:UDP-2-acetamido-2-deoxy-ribo-hexuluronate aminotransferase
MKFVDLDAQQRRIRFELERRILAVLDHGHYVLGPEIEELESRLGEYVGVSHALACASGTDALLMALMAYEIGPGDAVFTTPFSFFATAEVISLLGATPVFVDIEESSFNIDPVLLEAAIRDVANDERTHPVYRSMERMKF